MIVVEGIACKFYKDKEGEVYISAPFGDKYGIESGDAIVLDENMMTDTFVLVIVDAVCVFWGVFIMTLAWKEIMLDYFQSDFEKGEVLYG